MQGTNGLSAQSVKGASKRTTRLVLLRSVACIVRRRENCDGPAPIANILIWPEIRREKVNTDYLHTQFRIQTVVYSQLVQTLCSRKQFNMSTKGRKIVGANFYTPASIVCRYQDRKKLQPFLGHLGEIS